MDKTEGGDYMVAAYLGSMKGSTSCLSSVMLGLQVW